MANIQIGLPAVSPDVQTFLSQDYSSGTNLVVASSVGFTNGNYIVVGEPGLENTEVTNLTATPPDNTNLTVTTLKFSHPKGTPIFYTNWDKYSLEYATTVGGVFTPYAGMPQNLLFSGQYTEYRDVLATSTYQWRYRYFSSEKSAYSSYSDIIGASGWPRSSVGYMIKKIRKIVNDLDSKTISDTEIIGYLNEAQDIIYSIYDRWWFLFKYGTPILTIAGAKTYALPTDFGRMHSVLFEFIFGTEDRTYQLEEKGITEFDYISRDNTAGSDDNMKYYALYPPDASSATGYLRVWPTSVTTGLKITPRYYKTITDLAEYSDITVVPIPKVLENYAIGKIFEVRREDDKSAIYLGSLDKPGFFYTDITNLKLMQRKSARPMRNLWEYKGRQAEKRLFGNGHFRSQADVENFW